MYEMLSHLTCQVGYTVMDKKMYTEKKESQNGLDHGKNDKGCGTVSIDSVAYSQNVFPMIEG